MTIELKNVSYAYPVFGSRPKPAVKGVSVRVSDAECIGIAGPEGSGKSTLLFLLGALLPPDEGALVVDGTALSPDSRHVVMFRKQTGFSFQFPGDQFVGATIREELLIGLEPEAEHSIGTALRTAGFEDGLDPDRSPFTLSMGEARRLLFASIALREPAVLLLDEPTVGLDGHGMRALNKMLDDASKRSAAIVLCSHDLDFLADHADRLYFVDSGSLVAERPVHQCVSDGGLLARFGYRRPEVAGILEALRLSGKLEEGEFRRPRELAALLRSRKSE